MPLVRPPLTETDITGLTASLATKAPDTATFILQTANGDLSNAQVLGALTTGILYNTTATGVVSIAAAGTDYVASSGVSGNQRIFC